jgi:spoIIIJ-associated protein
MDYIEVKAKTIDDAITDALVTLGVTSDQLDYEVIEKGSNGFLGINRKDAVIRARKKQVIPEKKEEPVVETVSDEKSAEENKSSEKSADKKSSEKKSYDKKSYDKKPYDKKSYDKKSNDKKSYDKKSYDKKPYEKKSYDNDSYDKAEFDRTISDKPVDYAACEKNINEFLTQVFAAMELEVNIITKVDEENRTIDVDFQGPEMGMLIGKRGQTLDALQYLTNLAINKQSEGYVKIKLDTEDYRKRRKETLENLAKNIAYKVKRTKRPVSLEPMNPFERRVIHSALQNDRYVSTHSEGEEPYRHVVVTLKR